MHSHTHTHTHPQSPGKNPPKLLIIGTTGLEEDVLETMGFMGAFSQCIEVPYITEGNDVYTVLQVRGQQEVWVWSKALPVGVACSATRSRRVVCCDVSSLPLSLPPLCITASEGELLQLSYFRQGLGSGAQGVKGETVTVNILRESGGLACGATGEGVLWHAAARSHN